jgi:hypothetical protein
MARRAAIDLSGIALGMWEAAHLCTNPQTVEEGQQMAERLRTRLNTLKREPFLKDSLLIYIDKAFSIDTFTELLDNLEQQNLAGLLEKIEDLVQHTRAYLDDTRRTRPDFERAY